MPLLPKAHSSSPPRAMSWPRALPVLAICAVFDAVRFIFAWFVFFGPALVGIGTGVWLSQYIGDWAGGVVGGVAAGLSGFFGWGFFAVFGAVMAFAIGFAGWVAVLMLLAVTNLRIFKANELAFVWILLGWGVSEVPIINGLVPGLTVAIWKLYHRQIKKEQAALKAWRAEEERLAEERRAQDIAALRSAYQERLALQTMAAANDNEVIPEEVSLVA